MTFSGRHHPAWFTSPLAITGHPQPWSTSVALHIESACLLRILPASSPGVCLSGGVFCGPVASQAAELLNGRGYAAARCWPDAAARRIVAEGGVQRWGRTTSGATVITQDEELFAPCDVSTVDCTVGIVTSTTGSAAILNHCGFLP
jgi:hypothetical protein